MRLPDVSEPGPGVRTSGRDDGFARLLRDLTRSRPSPVLPGLRVAQHHLGSGPEERGTSFAVTQVLPGGRLLAAVGEVAADAAAASFATVGVVAVLEERLAAGAGLAECSRALDRLAAGRRDVPAQVCLVLLDPRAGTVRYLTAAHRPPMVLGEGPPRLLPTTPTAPLGRGGHRPVRATSLATGECLVLRAGGPDGDDDRLCDDLLELLRGPDVADTSIVVLQRCPPPGRLTVELPSGPGTLVEGQRRLDEWLLGLHAGPQDREALTRAVREVLANAVEHGSPDRSATVTLGAVLTEDGRVHLEVRDRGRWERSSAAATPGDRVRGLGLALAGQLVDDVHVLPAPTGTVVRATLRLGRSPQVHRRPGPGKPPAPCRVRTVPASAPGSLPTVRVSGDVVSADTGSLRTTLDVCSQGASRSIAVDLTGVGRVAGSAARLLGATARALRDHGCELVVRAPTAGRAGAALAAAGVPVPASGRVAPDTRETASAECPWRPDSD